MQAPEPQQEHKWLQRLVGEWTSEMEAAMGPDKPKETFRGTESVRSIGGLWMMCEGRGSMPDGGGSTTVMTLGYDPAKQRFVGTFLGSMMTFLWNYEGTLVGNVLTLDAEGPSFADPTKMSKYKDSIEFKSDDERILSSQFMADDGTWHHFMTATYRRKK